MDVSGYEITVFILFYTYIFGFKNLENTNSTSSIAESVIVFKNLSVQYKA